jgi:hypothetical protein
VFAVCLFLYYNDVFPIIVIIALSVACGYEYDFEYDWSRSSSPPKKEEVIPKAQVVDPKTQIVTGNPKFDFDNDEIHELREVERELIFQCLKKIVHVDHL